MRAKQGELVGRRGKFWDDNKLVIVAFFARKNIK